MERVNSLSVAIENEQREKNFYLGEAKRSNNPMVVRLMETLAKEEDDHMDLFKRLYGSMLEKGKWPENLSTEGLDSNLEDALSGLDYNAQETMKYDDDDLDALKRSVGFEKEASEFYAQLAQNSASKQEKDFFEFISAVEYRHQMSIEDSLAYFEDPTGWTMSKEHGGLDGA